MGWLSGWGYRKLHEIEGSTAGTQTNYQIRIIVHKGSGTDGGEHVYCNNHCRDDFGDIRLTKSDGETLLDYWMEEYTSGDKATFWVKVPSIPASPDKATIYIYYGKSDATTTSNGDNTFLFFDDFEGTSLDTSKWQYDTGWFSVSNSAARCTSKQKEIRSIENTFGDVEVRAKWRFSSGARGHICFRKEYDGNIISRVRDKGYDINFRNPNSDENLRKWPGSGASCSTLDTSSYTYSADTWCIGFIRGYGSSLEAKPTEDATLLSATDTTFSSGEIGIGTDDLVTIGTDYVEFDWIFVRKYVSPEPSHGAWGNEEEQSASYTPSGYEPLYFVNEQHTVNGLTAYKLAETNSETKTYVSKTKQDGSYQVWVAVRVFLRHSDQTETELTDGTYNLNVTRTSDGSGIQNLEWLENVMVGSGDALVVRVYLKVGSYDWTLKAEFITGQFTSDYELSSWVFRLWTKRVYNAGSPPLIPEQTTVYFYWGSTDYPSRIEFGASAPWPPLPPVSRYIDGKSVVGGRHHIYYNGCKEVIYIAYLNTSFSPWKYQVRCFDLESYRWYGPFNISDAPSSDIHYMPSISVLPDGRLIIMYGYYSPLKFRISTYSADTESNLTKLLSNWGAEYSISPRWTSNLCYPEAVKTDNYLLIFGRDGTSYEGNWTYFRFAVDNWVYSYVGSFDNSTYNGTWQFVGLEPYVDEFGIKQLSYLNLTGYESHYGKIGQFHFRQGIAWSYDETAYVEVLAASENASLRLSWNSTWLNVSGNTPTWLCWKVSHTYIAWSQILDYIEVHSEQDYPTTIYCVRLKLKITGISPAVAFIYTDKSCYLFYPRRFDDKIMVYGRLQDPSVGRYNHYFVYSDDEGFSWKVANGTEVKIPIELEEIKAVDIGGTNYRVWNKDGIIYNNTVILLASPFNFQVKNFSHPLVLIYYDNLGSPEGSWHIVNATLEDGNPIWMPSGFVECTLIYDEYYDRPVSYTHLTLPTN